MAFFSWFYGAPQLSSDAGAPRIRPGLSKPALTL
jgi:hypothetical protein